MILTVTLNPALDLTYQVDALRRDESHRVRVVVARAGGKGVNVARILGSAGHRVTATGLAGGDTGTRLRAELAAAGIRDAMCEIAGETRRTVAVHSLADNAATVFNEPGPAVRPAEWESLVDRFTGLLPECRVAVLSGSVPPGVPLDAYATLTKQAGEHGIPVVLDASGAALIHALPARPHLVKPNAGELLEVTGEPDPLAGAVNLRAAGAENVLVTRGPDGVLALCGDRAWRASPPRPVAGNPTGAGDACVAAVAAGLASGATWPEILREAVAQSCAAVAMTGAGEVDPLVAAEIRPVVIVEEINAARTNR